MSATAPCVPCCSSTPQTVNTPGVSGQSSVTTTTASFVIPGSGASVAISVGDTTWMKPGMTVFISDGAKGGNFFIVSVDSAVGIHGEFLALPDDSAPGGTIASGAVVVAGLGNYAVTQSLDTLPAYTDNSGGARSNIIAVGIARTLITLGPFSMALLVNNQIWEYAIPYNFVVNSILFRADIAITTGAKAATFTTRINGGATTGGVVAVAGTYATGATQAGTAISGGNIGSAGQTLEAIVSGVTAFSEGYGHLELNVTNTDIQTFVGQEAFNMNLLRTALRHQ